MEQNHFLPEMRGNSDFGCMRLPINGEEVNKTEFYRMADAFIAAGSNYFDTTHSHIRGKSRMAIVACVSPRYSRERLLLTSRLAEPYFEKQEDIRPFFMQQFTLCKVDYFDLYLMHVQNKKNYQKSKYCHAYETAGELEQKRYVHHLGPSFYNKAEVLDMILNEHPEIEFVRIRFNYLDYENDEVEGRKVYEICERHQKPVMVMEPVKGGSLVKLPEEADRILRDLNGGSDTSYAIRFAASFPQIAVVLSGMSNLERMEDNLATTCDFKPLMEVEAETLRKVCTVLGRLNPIPCTACHYCVEKNVCPKNTRVPETLGASNTYESFHSPDTINDYQSFMATGDHDKAADCIRCGKYEEVCPQHPEIRELLVKIVAVPDQQ